MDLPFDGAISAFFKDEAPAEIRNAIKRAEKGEILNPNYPHSERLARKVYEKDLHNLQIELAKLDFDTGFKHRMIPTEWVSRVDEHVHLNLTEDEAKARWTDKQ